MKHLIYIVALISITLSCSKEESILIENKPSVEIPILKFSSANEFDSIVSELVKLSEVELKAYEEAKGYMSFGRKAEEFYRSIRIEDFKTTDDIMSFVEANSQYLQLIKDEDGELTLETKFYKRSDRYLLNEDMMYQVGDTIVKVLEQGVALASVNDINVSYLKEINISTIDQGGNIKFVPNDNNDLMLKSYENNCGVSHEWNSTNGNDRTKLIIEVTRPWETVKCHFLARPYKKTLRIWFQCSRTMMADVQINFGYGYKNNDTGIIEIKNTDWNFYHGWEGTSKLEWTNEKYGNYNDYFAKSDQWFNSYDILVDSYSTSPIHETCWTNP